MLLLTFELVNNIAGIHVLIRRFTCSCCCAPDFPLLLLIAVSLCWPAASEDPRGAAGRPGEDRDRRGCSRGRRVIRLTGDVQARVSRELSFPGQRPGDRTAGRCRRPCERRRRAGADRSDRTTGRPGGIEGRGRFRGGAAAGRDGDLRAAEVADGQRLHHAGGLRSGAGGAADRRRIAGEPQRPSWKSRPTR